jgi:hypothetical protein
VLKFEWSDVVIPDACLVGGLQFRILLRGLVALGLMLLPFILSIMAYMISYCCSRVRGRAKESFKDGFKAAAMRSLPYMIVVSFCLFQVVSSLTLSAWDCAEFMLDSTTAKAFLRNDLSVECGTDRHVQIQNIAYIFFAIWPVGMPLLYLVMLLLCREPLVQKRRTPLTCATSFLHQEYTSRFFWWEPLFMLQRLNVTGFVMIFFQAEFAVRRIIFSLIVTLVYMVVLLIFRPYSKSGLNFLAALGSQFALAFSMFTAYSMRIFNDIMARFDLEGAQHIMKFDSPSEVRARGSEEG